MPNPVSYRYFKASPEIIQLAVILLVRFPHAADDSARGTASTATIIKLYKTYQKLKLIWRFLFPILSPKNDLKLLLTRA